MICNLAKLAARVGIYSLGLFFLALGVAFSINANLGISPVSSWPVTVHMASGLSAGFTKTMFLILCLLVQIMILGKNFKAIELTQLVFSFMFGFFLDTAIWIIGDFALPSYVGQLIMLFISIFFISTGLAIYLEARLVALPAEGIVLAFMQRYPHLTFQKIKIVKDCLLVMMSAATTLIFLGGLYGVREGTVLTALMVGRLTPIIRKTVERILKPAALFEISMKNQ